MQEIDMRTTLGLAVEGAKELMRQTEDDHFTLDMEFSGLLGRVSTLSKCHREAGQLISSLRKCAPRVGTSDACRPLTMRLLAHGHSSWHAENPPLERLPAIKRKENLARLLDAIANVSDDELCDWATGAARLARAL